MSNKEQSEFGKGLVICLLKFNEHFQSHFSESINIYHKWMKETPENRIKMISNNPPSNLNYGFPHMQNLKSFVKMADEVYDKDYDKAMSERIKMILNGASDHLYNIIVPKGKKFDNIRKSVTFLQNKALEIGHGFTDKIYTFEDYIELFKISREIALEIDKTILNIKDADMGQW